MLLVAGIAGRCSVIVNPLATESELAVLTRSASRHHPALLLVVDPGTELSHAVLKQSQVLDPGLIRCWLFKQVDQYLNAGGGIRKVMQQGVLCMPEVSPSSPYSRR
jgi:hypothetical protein